MTLLLADVLSAFCLRTRFIVFRLRLVFEFAFKLGLAFGLRLVYIG